MKELVRVAILDMNNNHPNQGLRCIKEIVANYPEPLDYEIFDVRGNGEIPGTDFDIYIGSGGPGSPLDDGEGELAFFEITRDLVVI